MKKKKKKVQKKIRKIKHKKNKKIIKKKSIKKQKKIKKKKKKPIKIAKKSDKFLLKIIELQSSLKPEFKIKFNPFVAIDNFLQKFFQKVSDTISKYEILKDEQKRIRKLNELERIENEKIERLNKIKTEKELKIKLKEQMLKDEIRLEKERAKDIKIFLRKEQAIIRKEQAERQKRFLQEIKLEKQIEKFRIRERVEALGVEIQDGDSREILLEKEKQYNLDRQKIELALESFYRSANSLVFQLNKRYITRQMSIFRCIDKRFENGEIFIKWDESEDEEWLILIYIKDNSPNQGIVIEDKTNPEKNISNEFQPNEIFKASDMMVDSLTQLISRIRSKKQN